MIKIENTEVFGWEAAIRGMRNPKNSWDKIDSYGCNELLANLYDCVMVIHECEPAHKCDNGKRGFCIGKNDFALMKTLANAGTDHGKFLRFITVTADITAPLYWWKEFDTYKVGTVANSCSTMHKIHAKEFTLDDFSHEYLRVAAKNILIKTIYALNIEREAFIGEYSPELKGDKECWYSMIQLLPSSYNQKRTVQLNYAVLRNMYHARKAHKLDEWLDFCKWVESLPYSELITGNANDA